MSNICMFYVYFLMFLYSVKFISDYDRNIMEILKSPCIVNSMGLSVVSSTYVLMHTNIIHAHPYIK